MSSSPEVPAGRVANPFGDLPVVAAPAASATALAGREVAVVQAMVVMAQAYPRNGRDAVDRILKDCTRVELAEKAVYQYARGNTDITGPSIRLAEVLVRGWRNIVSGVTELSRAGGYSEMLAWAWDLETNVRAERQFQVKHWRDTKKGGYTVTDERDIYEMTANSAARRKRACMLELIPGDVIDAALEQCATTLRTKIDVTPERIADMLEKFAALGVSKAQVEAYIQRSVEAITPALFVRLGRIYTSIEDGMGSPADWFEAAPASTGGGEAPGGAAAPPGKGTAAVAARVARASAKGDAAPASGGDVRREGGGGSGGLASGDAAAALEPVPAPAPAGAGVDDDGAAAATAAPPAVRSTSRPAAPAAPKTRAGKSSGADSFFGAREEAAPLPLAPAPAPAPVDEDDGGGEGAEDGEPASGFTMARQGECVAFAKTLGAWNAATSELIVSPVLGSKLSVKPGPYRLSDEELRAKFDELYEILQAAALKRSGGAS